MSEKSKVSTALDKIALIDLKITENQRLVKIEVDRFKTQIAKENVGIKKSKQKVNDLRQCPAYNEIKVKINELIKLKRSIILSTAIDL